jgi:hypothetical protein
MVFKSFLKKFNSKIKTLTLTDIQLIKLSVFAFTLLLAKLYTPLLSFNWYIYVIVFILAGIRPIYKMLKI